MLPSAVCDPNAARTAAVLVCTSSLEYAFSRWRRTVPAEIQSRAADLRVRHALGDQGQRLALPPGEAGDLLTTSPAGLRRPPASRFTA